MRRYSVKEIFGPTLQGEGPHTGQSCYFLRLAGCNAWDGRAETKASSACTYCDTDFRDGKIMSAEKISDELRNCGVKLTGLLPGLVITGGEPSLQLDTHLMNTLCCMFSWIDIETNGTRKLNIPLSDKIYIICSPKAIVGQPVIIDQVYAWKVLIPDQISFLPLALASNRPVYVQPVVDADGFDGSYYKQALMECFDICKKYPKVRLSLQTHKIIGLR